MAEAITVESAQYDNGDAFPNTLGFEGASPVAPAPRDLAAATQSDDDALPIAGDLPGSVHSNDDAIPIPWDQASGEHSNDAAVPISGNLPGSVYSNDDAVPIAGDLPNTIQSNDEAEAFGMDGLKFPPEGAVMDIEGHYLFVCT
ncbi:MAG: hypothetical protein AB3N64_08685 [Puniceicoccaceae bacterium]